MNFKKFLSSIMAVAMIVGTLCISASAEETYVAEVDGTQYTNIKEALKSLSAGSELDLLTDITITEDWDCRNHSGKTACYGTLTVPVTIDGNGHTFKLTGKISDGYNHLAVFRAEAAVTFKNLTIDLSEAQPVFQNRFSAISSKDNNLTVEHCTFIGSNNAPNARAIIFGETADHNDAEIAVTSCSFSNFKYGVTDNLNGKDVASVSITDSEFADASINISASEAVEITGNEVDGGYVKVNSYTQPNNLTVVAKENVLDDDFAADNQILAGEIVESQDGFGVPPIDIDGVKYFDLQKAVDNAADGATIKILDDIELTAQDANTALKPAYNRESYAGLIIPDDKAITIDLNGKTLSYVDEYYDCDNLMIINLGNLTINDSVGNGKITYKPVCGDKTYAYFYSTIFNCGTLTVNAGTIENTCETATDVSNAVDNHSRLSHEYDNNCILVVNGGTLIGAEYRAIRQYTHYFEGVDNKVTINDGTIKGGIYMQHGDSWYYADPSKNRLNVNCELEINGGNIIPLDDGYGHIRSRLANPDNAEWKIAINGGNIQVPVELQVQRGVYYANGVSGATVPAESTGARNAEWLEANGGFITGGDFSVPGSSADPISDVESFLADGFIFSKIGTGFTVVEGDDVIASISVEYKEITAEEGEKKYDIVLKANDANEINELASADLTFVFNGTPVGDGAMNYAVTPADDITLTQIDDRYMFNLDGIGAYEVSGNEITIGTITVSGFGSFTLSTADVDTNIVNATTLRDNLVDSYTTDGAEDDDAKTGALIINKDTVDADGLVGEITNGEIAVPERELTINITFPNAIEYQAADYQDMKVTIIGGNVDEEIALGDNAADYTIVRELPYNATYTVTVSGAGYRTARYSVTLTDDKTLNFWNNVMDNALEVEEGKATSAVVKNFLAGDIVKDNNINIYDLSAVVSYFGSENCVAEHPEYAKYDLNRDGVIDSKDVAYVLVSWNE